MIRWLALMLVGIALLAGPDVARAGPFSDWAAIVVAGDFHAAHSDETTETFDNARRDVAAELVRKGFTPANVLQFSVRPDRYPDVKPGKSDLEPIYNAFHDLTQRAKGGCLLYFSSHGAPQGMVLDDHLLPPGLMDQLVRATCGDRPTIIIISACFSGVFIPAMAESNRMILTAARPDRASFGCGESDKYPYFDTCMLQVLPDAHDFVAVAPRVQACVAQRETELGARPPSEPQVFIGPALRPILPLMALGPG